MKPCGSSRIALERRALLGGKKGRSAAKRLQRMGPAPVYGPKTLTVALLQDEIDEAMRSLWRSLSLLFFRRGPPRHKHRYRNKQRRR